MSAGVLVLQRVRNLIAVGRQQFAHFAEQLPVRARGLVATAFLVRVAHQLAQLLPVGIGMSGQQFGHRHVAVVAHQAVAHCFRAMQGGGLAFAGIAVLGQRVADRVQHRVVLATHLLG